MRSSSNVVASLMTHSCKPLWQWMLMWGKSNLCGPGLSGLFLIADGFYKLLWLLVLADVTRSVPPFCKIADLLLYAIITGLVPGFALKCRVCCSCISS